ncbi:MAG: orotidine-5'-phosphate decarboxylase [Candidatus Zambryskibacteria bacterium]|nr:orotidine-5'-phosphate decarboxylase [Candidatus Zambryskibacteria bacterium]
MKKLTPAERLIVAADFKPEVEDNDCFSGRVWVYQQVLKLAQSLKGTGVYIKVNSALRSHGYGLIDYLHSCGLKVFADLKLIDIGQTLSIDGILLREARPEIVTVSCFASKKAVRALKAELPNTEVLGVTVLTDTEQAECDGLFTQGSSILDIVVQLAKKGSEAGLDGIICAPTEAVAVRKVIRLEMTVNTPNVRPTWIVVKGDDQNAARQMTPTEAINVGVDRFVMGRPIIQSPNPYEAIMRTIEEITATTA